MMQAISTAVFTILMGVVLLCWMVLLPCVTVIATLLAYRLACVTLDLYYQLADKLLSYIR